MKTILTIFKKELIDTVRDRRTLLTMIVIPLLVFPLIFGVIAKIQSSQTEKALTKTLNVGVFMHDNAEALRTRLDAEDRLTLITDFPQDSIQAFIRNDSLDAAIVVDANFDTQVANMAAGRIQLFFKSTEDANITKRRVRGVLDAFEDQLRTDRFAQLNLNESVVQTLDVQEVDVASAQERLGQILGGFLPYIFIIFCFVGSMYPAIDLGAGEKERGTLETLLTSPANRMQIMLGKFAVISLTGLLSALIAIAGLYVGAQQITEIPEELIDLIFNLLQPSSIALLISLLLPLAMFFAGLLLALSFFAKSFKEAQSVITPLNIVVILPAVVGLLPGIKLNTITALVPVLNVSLATKEIIAGTVEFELLLLVYVSLILLGLLSLWVCSRAFQHERIIFRI